MSNFENNKKSFIYFSIASDIFLPHFAVTVAQLLDCR